MNNPFEVFDARLSNIENMLLDLKHSPQPIQMQQPDEIRFHGDKELAKYLNCTIQTISRLKMAGKIPFHRYGRKYYYLRSEIDTAFIGRR